MIDQSYTAKNFLRLMTRADPKKYRIGRKRADYKIKMQSITDQILDSKFGFSGFNKQSLNKKPVFSPKTVTDVFAMRKLNDNLKRVYRIKQSNRDEIIQQIGNLVRETTAFHIIKLDISSFYENINRQSILARIFSEHLLCYRSKTHLAELLKSPELPQTGLPRGLGISATISEMYMADFDRFVRKHSSVYYYARYVDDIIIFCFTDPCSVVENLKGMLPAGLHFGEQKYDIFNFNEKGQCLKTSTKKELNYLGYRFQFNQKNSDKKKGTVIVSISPSKIEKIKRRLMLSFFGYLRDKDFDLLQRRIAYLSGNHEMKREENRASLRSGIFYNYRLIDEDGKSDLNNITTFMCRAIFASRGAFGKRISLLLTKTQRTILSQYSFRNGFDSRILHQFSTKRIKKIREIWKYA